jgi:hypothetical protein
MSVAFYRMHAHISPPLTPPATQGTHSVYVLRYSTRPISDSKSANHDHALSINYATLEHALEGASAALTADPSVFLAIAKHNGDLVYSQRELRRALADRRPHAAAQADRSPSNCGNAKTSPSLG